MEIIDACHRRYIKAAYGFAFGFAARFGMKEKAAYHNEAQTNVHVGGVFDACL